MTEQYLFRIDLAYTHSQTHKHSFVTNIERLSDRCGPLQFLLAVARMIRLLIFISSFLFTRSSPFLVLLSILSHRYDINWILEISLANLSWFTRSSFITRWNEIRCVSHVSFYFTLYLKRQSVFIWGLLIPRAHRTDWIQSKYFHAT